MQSDLEYEVRTLLRLVRGARSREATATIRPWVAGNLRVEDASEFLPPLDVPPRHQWAVDPVLLDVYINTVAVEQWKITPGNESAPSAAAFSLVVRAVVHFMRCSSIHEFVQCREDIDVVLGDRPLLLHSEGTSRQVWSLGLDRTSVEVAVNPFWLREVRAKDARSAAEAFAVQQQSFGHLGGSFALPTDCLAGQAGQASFGGSANLSLSPGNSAIPTPPMGPTPMGVVGDCMGSVTSSPPMFAQGAMAPVPGTLVPLRPSDDPLNLPPSAVSHPFLRSDSADDVRDDVRDDDGDGGGDGGSPSSRGQSSSRGFSPTRALVRDLMTSALLMSVAQQDAPCDVRGLALGPLLATPRPSMG